jgi:hypothetical protein
MFHPGSKSCIQISNVTTSADLYGKTLLKKYVIHKYVIHKSFEILGIYVVEQICSTDNVYKKQIQSVNKGYHALSME